MTRVGAAAETRRRDRSRPAFRCHLVVNEPWMQSDLRLTGSAASALHGGGHRCSLTQAKKKGRIAGRGRIYFVTAY